MVLGIHCLERVIMYITLYSVTTRSEVSIVCGKGIKRQRYKTINSHYYMSTLTRQAKQKSKI